MANLAYDGQEGDRRDYTPSGALAAGQVVPFGITPAGFVGINESAIAADAKGSLNLSGEHTFAKVDGTAALDGAPAFWDVSESEMTPTDTDNILAGVFIGAVASAVVTCRVNIGMR